jgi:hypothetical protein
MESSQGAQSQPQFGEDVVLAAPLVEFEAVQDEGLNSEDALQVEVSFIVV